MTTEATLETSPEAPLETTPSLSPRNARLVAILTAPFRPRTLGAVLYNALAFPLGLLYFLALMIGTAVGVPLTLIWIGFLILLITGGLLWGFVAFERELAKLLLGAELAPMSAPPAGAKTVMQRLGAFLSNPVTWKGAAFLILKFPLGIASLVAVATGFSISTAFLLGPFLYRELWFRVDFGLFQWHVDSFPEALVASLFGLVALYLTLQVMNALGLGWRYLAEGMLGSESHRRQDSAPVIPSSALPAPAA